MIVITGFAGLYFSVVLWSIVTERTEIHTAIHLFYSMSIH